MSELEFQTLGAIDLSVDGRSLADVLGRSKQVALLALVAAEGIAGPVRRDRLTSVLWPESDEVRARRSLRQALYELRDALGPDSIRSRGAESLELGPVRCDLCEFWKHHQAGRLEEALELYRGEFLAGFHLNHNGAEFERWLEATQRSIAEMAAKGALTLADGAERAGNAAGALRWLARRLELVPYDEVALRRQIEIHLERDDAGQAIEAYREFARRLETELGLTPGESTTELAREIGALNGKHSRMASQRGATSPPLPSVASDLVGSEPSARPGGESAEGARRHQLTPTRIALAVTAVGVLAAAATALPGLLVNETLERHRVLVADVTNETGDPTFDHYGRLAGDWIVGGIVDSRVADVVRRVSAIPPASSGDDPRRLRDAAAESGAGTAVWGKLQRVGDKLEWRAYVEDVQTERVLAVVGPIPWSEADPDSALTALRDRLLGSIAAAADGRIGSWVGYVGTPPDIASYRSFRDGLRLYGREADYVAAAAAFQRAASGDGTFVLARLWEALAISSAIGAATASPEMSDRFDRTIDELGDPDRSLSTFERHFREYVLAHHTKGWTSQLAAIREVVELVPNSEYLAIAAKATLKSGDPHGALEMLDAIEPDAVWLRESEDFWMLLAQAYHEVGDLAASLDAAREARARHPQSIRSLFWLGMTTAALGRTDELEDVARAALSYGHESWILHPGGLLLMIGLELRTHGWDSDVVWLNRALQWYADDSHAPRDPALNAWFQAQRVRLGLELGRLDDARSIAESLHLRRDELPYVAVWPLVLVAAAEGERAEVDRLTAEWGELGAAGSHKRALAAAMLGETERALDLLAQAEALGHRMFDMTHTWGTQLEVVRSHPRFRELVSFPARTALRPGFHRGDLTSP